MLRLNQPLKLSYSPFRGRALSVSRDGSGCSKRDYAFFIRAEGCSCNDFVHCCRETAHVVEYHDFSKTNSLA